MTARRMLLLAFVVAAFTGSGVSIRAETRHVVMLFDERPELPGLASLDAEFSRTLAAKFPERVEIYREELDRSRFGPHYQALFRDFLRAKYAGRKIDAVVAVFSPSLDFLLAHGDEIFPGTPIIFCGIEQKELGARALPARVHGVLLKRQFAPTLALALKIHPRTRQVFVVSGSSGFDAALLESAREEFRPYESQVALTYLTGTPVKELLVRLAQLPPQSIVLFTTMFRDNGGDTFVPHEVVPLVSQAANAPVYGFLDQYLGRGIVGGVLYSASAQGAGAAELLARVLARPQVAASAPATEPRLIEGPAPRSLFDWQQLQRWRIRMASLPAGSEVLFEETSVWAQYRREVLAVVAALLIQAALIFWLLHERQSRHRAENAARETMSELAHLNRVAAAGELTATIAHEVNQPLGGIVARANAALHWLAREQPDVPKAQALLEKIVEAGHHASDVVMTVRALFRKDSRIRTATDINALIRAVISLVYFDLRKHEIELRMQLEEPLPPVAADKTQLQQVVLNLVMNAIDAMNATPTRTLSIRTRKTPQNTVHVAVEDSGTGISADDITRIFDPLFTTKPEGVGLGLSICRSIIANHNGKLWASSRPDQGSLFEFELPALDASAQISASAA